MRRSEAELLLGGKVCAWTAQNGTYYGTLIAVVGKPWRGIVRIEAVVSVAVNQDGPRMPLAEGIEIDVGGNSIRAWNSADPVSWRQSAIGLYVRASESHANSRLGDAFYAIAERLRQEESGRVPYGATKEATV